MPRCAATSRTTPGSRSKAERISSEPGLLSPLPWGTRAGMASTTDRIKSVRAVRQLRRVRSFYATAALVWAASTAWTGWQSPGSRQMWVSALLLTVFTGLLLAASLWLQRLQAAGPDEPAHHAAPRRAARPRHAHA